MSEAHIRPAEPGDIAAITRIYADAVNNGTATFEIEPPDQAEMARRQQSLLAGNYPYVAAERSGVVMRVISTPGRPIVGALRIRSMSIRNSAARD